jgi:hypothetical protein
MKLFKIARSYLCIISSPSGNLTEAPVCFVLWYPYSQKRHTDTTWIYFLIFLLSPGPDTFPPLNYF